MAKILYVSDSPTVPTGYGRVSRVLTKAFHDAGNEIICVGWGYQGEEHDFPFQIVPCNAQAEHFGEDIVAQIIKSKKPDILFSLGDPWMLEFIPELDERSTVCWMSYFPIDGYPIPPRWHNWIKNINIPICFSKFAKNLVAEILGNEPPLIYHGVDSKIYRPLDKSVVKNEILGRTDKFIVGCVARNQPRKNLPALIKAFAEFSKKKDDVLLYLHTQIRDVGWNIDELVARFELQNKVMATDNFNAMHGIPEEQLVKLYNLFDVFVLPTMSEGFGLPIIESQSCGTPVLVTDFSACSELVPNRQCLLKVKDTLVLGRNIEQAIVDTDDIVRKLNYFYNDWKRNSGNNLKKFSSESRALAEKLDWSISCKQFTDLISQVEPKLSNINKTIYPSFYRI